MAERLAAQQKRAVAMGTTFIIKPFADRLGVASVYVQTEEMRLYLKFAAVVSIDGSRVKHGRGVLLATAKCPFGKLQIEGAQGWTVHVRRLPCQAAGRYHQRARSGEPSARHVRNRDAGAATQRR